MDPNSIKTMAAAAGAAKGDPVYVNDVFSCDGYYSTGSSPKSVVNGLDLSGEGGMVWFKARNDAYDHNIYDTERGATYRLMPNNEGASTAEASGLTAFNSNGWTVGNSAYTNANYKYYAAYSFRKARGFFDIVTYTGDGVDGRDIAHNLGSVPGMIMVKATGEDYNWIVQHRSTGSTHFLRLNDESQALSNGSFWANTDPTSTHFTVGDSSETNQSTKTYIAYIFAHDSQKFGENLDEAIIKCGTYEGNDGSQLIDLGFEPQWILIKNVDYTRDWILMSNQNMWCGDYSDGNQPVVFPNKNNAETDNGRQYIDRTGLAFDSESGQDTNKSSNTYIYMAISRGPTRVPEDATKVFDLKLDNGSTGNYDIVTTNPVDLLVSKATNSYSSDPHYAGWYWVDRFRWGRYIRTSHSVANMTDNGISSTLFFNNGMRFDGNRPGWTEANTSTGAPFVRFFFTRAPSFFDLVWYRGNDADGRNIPHKLGVAPELIMSYNVSNGGNWYCQSKYIPEDHIIYANGDWGTGDNDLFKDTYATSTQITVSNSNDINGTGYSYILYLFASCPGVSKLGTYTGTGSAIDVDCGFTAGARWVMIKRKDGTGDWFIFDTIRGIAAGNDHRLYWNGNGSNHTSDDYIDPLNAGFTVTTHASVNTNTHEYIYMAIA